MPTVLIIAASPRDQDRLSLNREAKGIKQALERSRNRENWRIESNEAVTVEDLRRALLDYEPTIVHFSGHGDGEGAYASKMTRGPVTRLMPLLLHGFSITSKIGSDALF